MTIHLRDKARSTLELVATIVMFLVAVVFIGVASYHYFRPPARTTIVEPPLPEDPVSLVGATVAGCPQAPVAVVQWSDFRCAACGVFAQRSMPAIRRQYIDNCKLLLAFRHLPIVARDPLALRASELAACAGRQGKFWPMHDLLFEEQRRLQKSGLNDVPKRLALDNVEFSACIKSGSALPQIQVDAGTGLVLGVTATPTLMFGVVQKDNTVRVVRRVSRALEPADFVEIVDGLLRELKPM